MGSKVALDLVNYGVYPRGDGVIRASVTPVAQLQARCSEEGAAEFPC
jgi:RNA 3'-terminal phosphate cyclase